MNAVGKATARANWPVLAANRRKRSLIAWTVDVDPLLPVTSGRYRVTNSTASEYSIRRADIEHTSGVWIAALFDVEILPGIVAEELTDGD